MVTIRYLIKGIMFHLMAYCDKKDKNKYINVLSGTGEIKAFR